MADLSGSGDDREYHHQHKYAHDAPDFDYDDEDYDDDDDQQHRRLDDRDLQRKEEDDDEEEEDQSLLSTLADVVLLFGLDVKTFIRDYAVKNFVRVLY